MEALKSAVLLDIENLVIAAKDDLRSRKLNVSIEDISNAICEQIYGVTSELGYFDHLYGAVSLPSVSGLSGVEASPQDSGRLKARKDIWKVAQVFIDRGFEARMVRSSKNAADNILLKIAEEIVRDKSVETVLLCSGDGQEPFPKIIQTLTDAGMGVWVLSYNQPPLNVRDLVEGGMVFECFTIGPKIRMFFEEGRKSAEDVSVAPESLEDTGVVKPKKESIAEIYREVVRAVQSAKPISHPIHHERLLRAVYAIDNYFHRSHSPSTLSLHRLIALVEAEFPEVESEERKKLIYAFIDYTTLFFHVDHYGINAHSEDRKPFQLQS